MSEKKEKKVETKEVPRVIKPVLPKYYSDGIISMPSVMITTREKFFKLWKGGTRGRDVGEAWDKAKAWKDSHRK